ncbi:MAG: hypothetical protein SynsKO_13210 [Synoicihabitans sp.]
MKILVTGCSGYVGRVAVNHLLTRGHEVRGIDLVDPKMAAIDFQKVDLFDAKALRRSMENMEAILHLAGIPNPGPGAEKVFQVNCAGTFNLYTAAADCGIKRVVVASSIHAVGYFFGIKPFELSDLPVDEDHEKFTTDSYSFSKQITEDIGNYFWRRNGISSASLRFGAGWHNPKLTRAEEINTLRGALGRLNELAAMPEKDAIEAIGQAGATFDDMRGRGLFEGSTVHSRVLGTPDLRLIWMRHTLFSYVDLNDACEAMELSLSRRYEGSHPLFVVHPENILSFDAAKLARIFYPQVTPKTSLRGCQSLLSGHRAESVIGFRAATPTSRLWKK